MKEESSKLKYAKELAKRAGLTEKEINTLGTTDFHDLTKSPRILTLMYMAYHRGQIAGVKLAEELDATLSPSQTLLK